MSYQRITLVGNLGADPEFKTLTDGTPVCNLRVAVNRRTSQGTDETIWFRVTAWRKLAETAHQYLTKGRQILVEGTLKEPNAYLDKEGNPRATLEVTANDIRFLGGRTDEHSAVPSEIESDTPF